MKQGFSYMVTVILSIKATVYYAQEKESKTHSRAPLFLTTNV